MNPLFSIVNDNTIELNEKSHRYKLNGKYVPGVTTFVKGGMPDSYYLTRWKIGQGANYALENANRIDLDKVIEESKDAWQGVGKKAAAIGTFVHDYAYFLELENEKELQKLSKKLEGLPEQEKIKSSLKKVDEWHLQNTDELVASEQLVASIRFQFGGKFDRLARRNGVYILSDFKTSNGFYVDQFVQLAAYRLAIREWMNIDIGEVEILRFGKVDGDFEVRGISDTTILGALEQQAIRCKQTFDTLKIIEKQIGS